MWNMRRRGHWRWNNFETRVGESLAVSKSEPIWNYSAKNKAKKMGWRPVSFAGGKMRVDVTWPGRSTSPRSAWGIGAQGNRELVTQKKGMGSTTAYEKEGSTIELIRCHLTHWTVISPDGVRDDGEVWPGARSSNLSRLWDISSHHDMFKE